MIQWSRPLMSFQYMLTYPAKNAQPFCCFMALRWNWPPPPLNMLSVDHFGWWVWRQTQQDIQDSCWLLFIMFMLIFNRCVGFFVCLSHITKVAFEFMQRFYAWKLYNLIPMRVCNAKPNENPYGHIQKKKKLYMASNFLQKMRHLWNV